MWYLDEINVVRSEDSQKSETKYEEYFSSMVLGARQLKRRIQMAKELEEALFLLFLAWFYEADEEEAEDNFRNDYLDIVEKYDDVGLEDEFVEYIVLLAAALQESTEKNRDDPYFTSFDRASYVAANEANTALNKIEYAEAKADGKTKKTWHTERDLRVRKTHVPLEGQTIPIDGVFNVGGVKMKFPKDMETDPGNLNLLRETANCRCTVAYS